MPWRWTVGGLLLGYALANTRYLDTFIEFSRTLPYVHKTVSIRNICVYYSVVEKIPKLTDRRRCTHLNQSNVWDWWIRNIYNPERINTLPCIQVFSAPIEYTLHGILRKVYIVVSVHSFPGVFFSLLPLSVLSFVLPVVIDRTLYGNVKFIGFIYSLSGYTVNVFSGFGKT